MIKETFEKNEGQTIPPARAVRVSVRIYELGEHYFGVSRSSTAVIAYIMKTHNFDYNQAFEFVKSKRKFVQPNNGFVKQLKLFHKMNYKIDDRIAQENPEPIVYRCKKCRRIVASQSNLLPHNDKSIQGQKIPCKSLIFVEPIGWMKEINKEVQGRLNCPKCSQKLGSFTWINGLNCPCGKEISPAFYMVPSKVELSKMVQNVERTI
uniref:protein-tyrosine-phosphatase n=1 Tax=Megaselia scalaris TaxID=36166 RepID=T1GAI1_MEGSC